MNDPNIRIQDVDYKTMKIDAPMKALTGMPQAWFELLRAIALLSSHATSEIRPFQCSHDQLWVCADPEKFTDIEIAQLEEWGFHVSSDGGFYSFRYGSA